MERLAGHVARIGENKDACTILVGNPEGKRQLRRSGCRRNFVITKNLKEIRVSTLDRNRQAHERDNRFGRMEKEEFSVT